jgi:amidase
MSADITSLELFAKAIVDSQGWLTDPNIVPIPWRTITLPEKLCFGLLVDDGVVRPLPPVLKALERTRRAIEAAGHTVIEYKPYVHLFDGADGQIQYQAIYRHHCKTFPW